MIEFNHRSSTLVCSFFSFLYVVIAASITTAQPPIIAVDAIYPPVGTVGTLSEVRVYGKNIQAVDQLHFSHPGISASCKPAPPLAHDDAPQLEFGTFAIKIDASVPTGVYEAHASGRYGISNPRSFVVVSEPVVLIPDDGSPEAKKLTPGAVSVGKLRKHDRVTLALNGGSIQSLTCATHVFDSLALPKVAIKNANGNTIRSDRTIDRNPIAWDSIPAEDLRLEISDEIYRGGEAFAYAICANPKPDNPLKNASPYLPASAIVSVDLPNVPIVDANRQPDEKGPLRVTPPVEIVANNPRDLLVQWNDAETPMELQVFSNNLGHPTDFRALAYRPSKDSNALGSPFQTSEDSPALGSKGVSIGSLDPRMTFPKKEGSSETLLSLSNLQTANSRGIVSPVRVRIGPSAPRFVALAHWTPWTNNAALATLTGSYLPRGGQLGLHLIVQRAGGFGEPVEFSLVDAPPGITAKPTVIHPSQSETEMVVYASEDAAPFVGLLKLVARSQLNGQSVEQMVYAATIHQGATAERGLPRSRLTPQLMLKVNEQELAPITIQCSTEGVLEVKAGEKLKLPLVAKRRAGGEAKCVLRAQNLPSKATLADTELAPNALEASPELVTTKETPAGEYSICFQAEMPWKLPLHPESLANHVAYRDRLKAKLDATKDEPLRKELEQSIATANTRIEQLTKETAARDFPTFFYTTSIRIRVLPSP